MFQFTKFYLNSSIANLQTYIPSHYTLFYDQQNVNALFKRVILPPLDIKFSSNLYKSHLHVFNTSIPYSLKP